MALTTSQTVALFQVLEVPYSNTIGKMQDADNLRVLEMEVTNAATGAKYQIEAHLAALDSEVETELASLIDAWIDLGTGTYEIDGGIGDIQGLSYSDDAERDLIRRRIIVIVPYYRYHEELVNRDRGGRNIGLIR